VHQPLEGHTTSAVLATVRSAIANGAVRRFFSTCMCEAGS
jgi:hypothetical protein